MKRALPLLCLVSTLCALPQAAAAPATLLFEDDFNRAITGWTAVQPPGTYIEGPMRWQWDRVLQGWTESSNIYTDNATASPTGTAVMLVNDTVATPPYTYRARLTAGDDDGFGLVFGYQDPLNCYRITFARQTTGRGYFEANGYPFIGWHVDRKVENAPVRLFGAGTPNFTPSFVNRANIPFDVTISVTADQKLTITLVDDPTGAAPVTHTLVDNQAIPTSAAGKVGILSWGMSSGNPSGFLVKNMDLSSAPLVNNPVPDLLTQWEEAIPPRNSGVRALGGQGHGNWSMGLGANGSLGQLLESCDLAAGNDAGGQLDFISTMLITGNPEWRDYVVSARMVTNDDDGQGLIVRFKDDQNFYRISMRNQSSPSGARQGLSIQKIVNGVWEAVYIEPTPLRYNFPANVPFEISAAVYSDQLQVVVVTNPGAANSQTFIYGPYTVTGVDSGRAGFFSWAMNAFRADWFRVHGIEGVPLIVSSSFATASPVAGVNSFAPGSSVTASVPSPFEESPGVRRIATGWTGSGDVPSTGTESTVTFALNNFSSISWNWRSEYQVQAAAGAGGTVTQPPGEWLAEGTTVTLTATANPGFVFKGWTGTSSSRTPELALILTGPVNVTAQFAADTDNDGLPDEWETANFGNLNSGAADDPDNDTRSNLAEYQRGSAPNFAETLILSGGLRSRWINAQRDPSLAGMLIIRDFGNGYRGVWENSNDYREADTNPFLPPEQRVANVSFEGPRMIVDPLLWPWADFKAYAIFSVADDDGNCVYFRYKDENNWYRATFNGTSAPTTWRAPIGLSIQKRVNGVFSELARYSDMWADPTDINFFKRFRISVNAQGSSFDVRASGWDAILNDWSTLEAAVQFTDADHATGTFGVGTWGQSGTIGGATATNPVDQGALIEDVVATTVTGKGPEAEVFREEWALVPLPTELPAGWTVGLGGGGWQVTAHHSILQSADFGAATTATATQLRVDGEGPALLAPALTSANYFLELGFHPFDDDGIGFVYNFQDSENYSRVMFVSQASAAGRLPQGLSVSHKTAGAWTSTILGDTSFVYTPGSPFKTEFSSSNGQYQLRAWSVDNPTAIQTWTWTGPVGDTNKRFGLASWQSIDAHFTGIRAYSLPAPPVGGEIRITGFSVSGGQLTLNVSNSASRTYRVLRSSDVAATGWTEIANNQTGATWSGPVPATGNNFWIIQATQ